MKRTLMLLFLAGAVFLLFGCMEMLTMNIFAAADTPPTPAAGDLAEMDDEELVAEISGLVESDSFYEDLAADDTGELKAAVLAELNDILVTYNDPPPEGQTEEEAEAAQQQALEVAVLVAEVELNSTDAGEVVDNFVSVATTFIDTPPNVETQEGVNTLVQTVVSDVFPEEMTRESFDETIDALLAAADAYTFFGTNLDTDPDTGEVVAPEGSNIGAISQDAVVSLLVSEVLTSGAITEDELAAVVLDGADFPETFNITDNPLETNTALVNVLEASGLGALFGDTTEGGI